MYTHPPFPFPLLCLVARPPVGTKRAPIKRRHGLIRRPNLHLNKEGLHVVAIRARRCRPIRGRPGVFPTEHIIHFFPLQLHGLADFLGDGRNIGAGLAAKPKADLPKLHEQQVRADGTELHGLEGAQERWSSVVGRLNGRQDTPRSKQKSHTKQRHPRPRQAPRPCVEMERVAGEWCECLDR